MKALLTMTHLPVKLSALAASLVLTACGGGGTETITTFVPPPPLALQSSGADLNKYANAKWISDCGMVFVIGGQQNHYQINTISFGAPIGSTIPGTITVSRYTQNNCDGASASAVGSVGATAVNFKYVAELNVTSASPATALGKADQLQITETVSRATQTFTVGFATDYAKFYSGSSSHFSSISLPYKKYPL
jgi:hypothetical protein